ncbi:MAG: pteridine reductase [Cocleimonas sp.]|jgi:pteridine reductase
MQKLAGKVALVTGAARRIGACTVRMLHQHGAKVVVHYRNSKEDAETLCNELNELREGSCFTEQAELGEVVSLEKMIESVISKEGRLDILINNASSFFPTKIGEITEDHWDNLFSSNLKAPLFLSQAAAPYLAQSQGCIVNMVDIHAERPLAEHPTYCAAKAGLLMLTKSLAKELGPQIRVNGVSPGAILWPEADGEGVEVTLEHQVLLDKTSLKREGLPDDIAKTISFLVCDAPYITGHIIPVDGGRLLNQ